MLNKDPERHVRLMPLEFELTGQLSAVPSQFSQSNLRHDTTEKRELSAVKLSDPNIAGFGSGIQEFYERQVSQIPESKDNLHNLLPLRERAQSQATGKTGSKEVRNSNLSGRKSSLTARKRNMPRPKGITYVPITEETTHLLDIMR